MLVRALIVEDEPLGRRAIRDLLCKVDWITVVGEAADGPTAAGLIETQNPDLVFLDVELPEYSGLQAIEHVSRRPAIVFVTAYDQYAISAFELEAIDYLVKPFGSPRFAHTLRRIHAHFVSRRPATEPGPATRPADLTRLFLRKRHEIVPVLMTAVSRLAAEGDYSRVFVGEENYLSHLSLGEFERRLDARRFVRVHRSLIINLDYVRSMQPLDERRFGVRMHDGFEATASRAGSERLRQLFG